MKEPDRELNIIEELERLDAFYDGEIAGEYPIEVLRSRGIEIPDEATLDDAALHERLWTIINAMAEVGMYLESTDHLSDRDLYRYVVTSALTEETILPSGPGGWHISPIGGCSEEDIDVYLRYYADEETREMFRSDGADVPPHEELPYDRDQLLPQQRLPMADA